MASNFSRASCPASFFHKRGLPLHMLHTQEQGASLSQQGNLVMTQTYSAAQHAWSVLPSTSRTPRGPGASHKEGVLGAGNRGKSRAPRGQGVSHKEGLLGAGKQGSRPELLLLRGKLETCHAGFCCSCHLFPLLARFLLRFGHCCWLACLSLLAPAAARKVTCARKTSLRRWAS